MTSCQDGIHIWAELGLGQADISGDSVMPSPWEDTFDFPEGGGRCQSDQCQTEGETPAARPRRTILRKWTTTGLLAAHVTREKISTVNYDSPRPRQLVTTAAESLPAE